MSLLMFEVKSRSIIPAKIGHPPRSLGSLNGLGGATRKSAQATMFTR